MKITNKFGLPQPLYDAIVNDGYTRGDADISVTELIGPPAIVALKRKHWDELEEDASDRIWSLCGQIIHGILERSDKTGISERRLSINVNGWRVSGGMDRYENGVLQDWKFQTFYKYKYNQAPEEVVKQLNCYAHILREHGHPVTRLEAVAILRDWSVNKVSKEPDYPQSQWLHVPVEMWPPEKARDYLYERVKIHQQARDTLPECTPEERWNSGDKWALMKKGRKSALKLFTSKAEAALNCDAPDLYVEDRPGEDKRCENYCLVSSHCPYYQNKLKQNQTQKTKEPQNAI